MALVIAGLITINPVPSTRLNGNVLYSVPSACFSLKMFGLEFQINTMYKFGSRDCKYSHDILCAYV